MNAFYKRKPSLHVNMRTNQFFFLLSVQPVGRTWLRRSLFRSPSMPNPVARQAVKRPDCPGDENTPISTKRRRRLAGTQVSSEEEALESPRMVSPHLYLSWWWRSGH